jgi:hypothetical protein
MACSIPTTIRSRSGARGIHAGQRNRVSLWALLPLFCVALEGCAPDSVRSGESTGFNGFLRQIAADCRPLQFGNQNIGDMLRRGGDGTNDYDYFLNVTSQLYYNRMSPAEYRNSLTGFFGPGRTNDASFACLFDYLPDKRPNAPVPR